MRAFISDAHTRKMDLNTKSLRAYWENYERSLDGDPWDILNDVEDPTAFGVESWTDILDLTLFLFELWAWLMQSINIITHLLFLENYITKEQYQLSISTNTCLQN